MLYELFDPIEAPSDIRGELLRRAEEIKEAGRVHLYRGEAGQLRKLLGVWLRSRDDDGEPVLRSVGRRIDQCAHELADQLLRRLVALYEVRLASNTEGEQERRL